MRKIKFIAQTRSSGDLAIAAWVNNPDSEIVAHQEIKPDEKFGNAWILSHRRTGLSIMSWRYRFDTRSEALRAAARIEGFPEWNGITRGKRFQVVKGLPARARRKLRAKIDAAVAA